MVFYIYFYRVFVVLEWRCVSGELAYPSSFFFLVACSQRHNVKIWHVNYNLEN